MPNSAEDKRSCEDSGSDGECSTTTPLLRESSSDGDGDTSSFDDGIIDEHWRRWQNHCPPECEYIIHKFSEYYDLSEGTIEYFFRDMIRNFPSEQELTENTYRGFLKSIISD